MDVDRWAGEDEEASALHTAEQWQDHLAEDAWSSLVPLQVRARDQVIGGILDLVQLHHLILDELQGFHLVLDEVAVAGWQHPEEYSLESEALSPLLADRRRQLRLEVLQLVEEVVDFLVDHVLLLGSAALEVVGLSLGHAREVLEELLDLVHLEVVEANCPYKPIEVLSELQVLSSDNQAVEGARLHAGQPSAHLDLLLEPVPVAQIQQCDHQLDLSVKLNLLQMLLDLRLLLVLHRLRRDSADVLLEAGHVQLLVVQLEDLLPLIVL